MPDREAAQPITRSDLLKVAGIGGLAALLGSACQTPDKSQVVVKPSEWGIHILFLQDSTRLENGFYMAVLEKAALPIQPIALKFSHSVGDETFENILAYTKREDKLDIDVNIRLKNNSKPPVGIGTAVKLDSASLSTLVFKWRNYAFDRDFLYQNSIHYPTSGTRR
jgi:hypothetical protein